MKKISALVLAAFVTAATFGVASAQNAQPAPPAWSPPPGSTGGQPLTGYNADLWAYMSVKKTDENALRIVGKEGWGRARQAAAAINAGRCGEAAVIAAQANDARLMEGVKRACKPV